MTDTMDPGFYVLANDIKQLNKVFYRFIIPHYIYCNQSVVRLLEHTTKNKVT